MTLPFDAVLFDLDGVLVDTEALIGTLWADIFAGQGLNLSAPDITRLTSGQRFEGVLKALEEGRGWKAPEDFLPLLNSRFDAAFDHVPPLEGAADTLQALEAAGVPFAVASNSERHRLQLKLRGAGLDEVLAGRAYDPAHVGGRGKPQPELYLYAAGQLGAHPSRCLVIEDSVPGAAAGLAAGMTVWGLLAGGHILPEDEARLRELGVARLLHSHQDLRAALGLSPVEAQR
ncbi:HAD-IA family hydrolase [Deinococcus sp. HMF7620]|uniref:HAD-IA family hydrolase n=1 Tax=Deinococcus arboris TaxID=2682977 RepID=A0A7C9HY99_9DEIO|nr:HAD-IA family hydrolase [Deinococcus arboris]MVN85955.1 HAD-IA family hydrolase [Deinococcus arboris]